MNVNDPITTLTDVRSAVWAIVPEYLKTVSSDVDAGAWSLHARQEASGVVAPDKDEIVARAKQLPRANGGNIAVLPIRGVITQHGFGWLDALIGGTRLDVLGPVFDRLMAEKSVASVVLDIHSPGGTVYGVTEMAAKIRDAGKPVIAVANSMAGSAAYALASAAEQVAVPPSGQVGSIGVLTIHEDHRKAEESAGIETTVISAGKYKGEGWEPLTDGAREAMQKQVDAYYKQFVADVAKGRGVTTSVVEATYGQGRMVNAADAKAAGMVDRVATLEEVLASMMRSRTPRRDAAEQRMRLSALEMT